MKITDPMEKRIAAALDQASIEYKHEVKGLDFHLVHQDIYLEVKQFHTYRIAMQMERAPNVIAIQGSKAVDWFCRAIKGELHP